MKKLLILLGSGLLMGAGFEKSGASGSLAVKYEAEKPLAVGNNEITLTLTEKGKPVEGADVKLKYFMPEMPGMPQMEYGADGEETAPGVYRVQMHFSMGGTWQGRLYVITKDGKKFLHKSSVIL